MKNKVFLMIFSFSILGCNSYLKKHSITNNTSEILALNNNSRFSNYELLSDKLDTIEVKYIQWAATDRPNFITVSNYNLNYNNPEKLLEECFYLDTKEKGIWNFPSEIKNDLQNEIGVRFLGSFIKQKNLTHLSHIRSFKFIVMTPKTIILKYSFMKNTKKLSNYCQ